MTSEYVWYVFTKDDPYTNRVVSEFIRATIDDEMPEVLCGDGQRRRMWRTSRQNAEQLWDKRIKLGLQLEIFNQKGGGTVRKVTVIFTDNFKNGKKRINKPETQKKLF